MANSQFMDAAFTYNYRKYEDVVAEFHKVREQCRGTKDGGKAREMLMQRATALAWILRPAVQGQQINRIESLVIPQDVCNVLDGISKLI